MVSRPIFAQAPRRFWLHNVPKAGTLRYNIFVRLIKRRTLLEYGERHSAALEALIAWADDAEASLWASPHDIKAHYANASILGDGRVVFNIKGNSYRLIVSVNFAARIVYIKWFGTHAEYDRVDAATVDFEGGQYG